MAVQLPTPDPQATEVGGARMEDDLHRCLYLGTLWEEEVVADRRDVDDFKEASLTIRRVLSVRVLDRALDFLALGRFIPQSIKTVFCFPWRSLLLIGRRLG
jgi:hypothetical protein